MEVIYCSSPNTDRMRAKQRLACLADQGLSLELVHRHSCFSVWVVVGLSALAMFLKSYSCCTLFTEVFVTVILRTQLICTDTARLLDKTRRYTQEFMGENTIPLDNDITRRLNTTAWPTRCTISALRSLLVRPLLREFVWYCPCVAALTPTRILMLTEVANPNAHPSTSVCVGRVHIYPNCVVSTYKSG